MNPWPLLLLLWTQPPVPPTPEPAPAPAAPAKPIFRNEGKPIFLDAKCGATDIEDAGLDCTADDPCPLYLDLTSIDTVMLKIFVTGNVHTGSATLAGLLLVSEDGGRTWSDATPRLPGATLEQLQFAGFETGFASGHQTGALLKDPFFLKTRDGGRTWEKMPVFDETTIGIIDSFWFDTSVAGVMVVDRQQAGTRSGRYHKYETFTGGTSWLLKEVSPKPIATRRPKGTSANEAWRLRPDGVIKAIRVEKRDGSQWRTVASFLIQAGACRPEALPQ